MKISNKFIIILLTLIFGFNIALANEKKFYHDGEYLIGRTFLSIGYSNINFDKKIYNSTSSWDYDRFSLKNKAYTISWGIDLDARNFYDAVSYWQETGKLYTPYGTYTQKEKRIARNVWVESNFRLFLNYTNAKIDKDFGYYHILTGNIDYFYNIDINNDNRISMILGLAMGMAMYNGSSFYMDISFGLGYQFGKNKKHAIEWIYAMPLIDELKYKNIGLELDTSNTIRYVYKF